MGVVLFGEKMLIGTVGSFFFLPPLDRQMPSVQKTVQERRGTPSSHPRSLNHLAPGKLPRCPRRAVAGRGPFLAITDTRRSARPRTGLPPRTPGGRTPGP